MFRLPHSIAYVVLYVHHSVLSSFNDVCSTVQGVQVTTFIYLRDTVQSLRYLIDTLCRTVQYSTVQNVQEVQNGIIQSEPL